MFKKAILMLALIWLVVIVGCSSVLAEEQKKEEIFSLGQLHYLYGIVFNLVEKGYFKELTPTQLEIIRKIQNEALEKIVSGVDKYSHYHSAEEFLSVKEDAEGKFEGVGIALTIPNLSEMSDRLAEIIREKIPSFSYDIKKFNPKFIKAIHKWIAEINPEAKELHSRIEQGIIPASGVLIEEIVPESPAEKAGLKKGWHIIEVDEKKLEGLTMKEITKLIKGPSGTKVTFTLSPLKDETDKPTVVEVTRGVVKSSTVISKLAAVEIGYIKLDMFYAKADEDFKEKMASLKESGMKKLIIDLRNNPGGELKVADKILETLLPSGRVTIYGTNRSGELTPLYSPPENKVPKIFSGKIAILINGKSASASELITISLKEQVGALVVGQKSFGKGAIQTVVPLPDGSALRLTTGHYLSPVLGEDIDGKGVVPDVEITDDPSTDADEVIEKAIEILK